MSNIQLHTRHPQPPAWLNSVKLQRQASWLLRQLQVKNRSLCIVLVNDHEISQLNSQFRQKNGPTNVLSFPASTGTPDPFPGQLAQELGDIVISLDTAAHEAISLQQSPHQRLSWLLTHGILHLLGWDHERSPDEAEAMYTLEQQLLTRLTHHRRTAMTRLAINVDHIATIRQARGGKEPDPVTAAAICELAGAMGIVVHLREDRRHIQDRDLFLLRQTVKSKLNLEMAAAPQIIDIALRVKPDLVTLVPEKRQELTTEGGLNVQSSKKKISMAIEQLHQGGIPVSLFIDPEEQQIATSSAIGADFVELHTGRYCEASNEDEQHQLCTQLTEATEQACQLGLKVNAGHGLDYRNTAQIAAIDGIEELSIGHAIISRAAFVGLDQAVREMLAIIRTANSLL